MGAFTRTWRYGKRFWMDCLIENFVRLSDCCHWSRIWLDRQNVAIVWIARGDEWSLSFLIPFPLLVKCLLLAVLMRLGCTIKSLIIRIDIHDWWFSLCWWLGPFSCPLSLMRFRIRTTIPLVPSIGVKRTMRFVSKMDAVTIITGM